MTATKETSPFKANSFINLQERQQIVDDFVGFHNLENASKATQAGHNLWTNGIYSDKLLPLVAIIHQYGLDNENPQTISTSEDALMHLDAALNILSLQSKTDNLANTLPLLHNTAVSQGGSLFQGFYTHMANARTRSIECIETHLKNGLFDNPDDIEHAQAAIQEHEQTQKGLRFPIEFIEQIQKTKALVLSLDWNSTFNINESWGNPHLISRFSSLIHLLSQRFHQIFPEKDLFVIINTGRPGLYAWAAIESLSPIADVRQIGIAESGGIVLQEGITSSEFVVAVDHPQIWKKELSNLKTHLFSKIDNATESVHVEPKDSMLSIKIANKNTSPDRSMLHHTKGITSQPITPEWINKATQEFIHDRLEDLQKQIKNLTITIKHDDQDNNDNDDGNQTALTNHLAKLNKNLQVIETMESKLVCDYNPTAGYIDIRNSDLNKYSTILRELAKRNIAPEQATVIHVGDSSTDLIPEDQTGSGEINQGADNVMLIGVANSSENLRKAIARRHTPHRGKLTFRPSILGLMDTILGLTNALFKSITF